MEADHIGLESGGHIIRMLTSEVSSIDSLIDPVRVGAKPLVQLYVK